MDNLVVSNANPIVNQQQTIIINKIPEYIIRAKKAYYNRNKDNEEFKQKQYEKNKKWREDNRNDYNERQKLIMRERRAKAKVAKEEALKQIESIVEKSK
jgi:hypothetical protein